MILLIRINTTNMEKGVTAKPTMCISTIKNKHSHPDRPKSQIVVLRDQDRQIHCGVEP